jgi:hypothetical protein
MSSNGGRPVRPLCEREVKLTADVGRPKLCLGSSWFTRECLLQYCQPVERGWRQRSFLNRGECVCESYLRECRPLKSGWPSTPNLAGHDSHLGPVRNRELTHNLADVDLYS